MYYISESFDSLKMSLDYLSGMDNNFIFSLCVGMQEMPIKSQPISHWHDHINTVSGERKTRHFCHISFGDIFGTRK